MKTDRTAQAAVIAQSQTQSKSGVLTLVAVALMGLGLITVAGHVQATTLHDAAHDVRHATGFPCH